VKLRYFKRSEFACRCGCGTNVVRDEFLAALDEARHLAGIPFEVNSGSRCAKNNKAAGGKRNSAHLSGWAADVRATTDAQRWAVIRAAIRAGFARIGVAKTFVHLDLDPKKAAGVVWLY
jgi:zinc D-Ala-D-Ala carboxypeptidase